MKRGVVYTIITGGKDTIRKPYENPDWDYYYFTDSKIDNSVGAWKYERLDLDFKTHGIRKCSRFYKLNPGLSPILKEYEHQLYIDGTIELIEDPEKIVELLGPNDLALYKHPVRKCIYEEADAVVRLNREKKEPVDKVVAKYREEGFPENLGLTACSIIMRRNTPKIQEFNELWWKCFEEGSRRDQLSFCYSCWKLGITYSLIPGSVDKPAPYFNKYGHKISGSVTDFDF